MGTPVFSADLLAALDDLGVGSIAKIRRVVIDIRANDLPTIYVEHTGTDKLINVVQALSGVQVSIVDEP